MFLHLWTWHRKADKHDERMREFEIVYQVEDVAKTGDK